MKTFVLIMGLFGNAEVIEVDNLASCKAKMKEMKIEAVINGADSVNEFQGVLTITKEFEITTIRCGISN